MLTTNEGYTSTLHAQQYMYVTYVCEKKCCYISYTKCMTICCMYAMHFA